MAPAATAPSLIHYLPLLTTVLSAVFCVELFRRHRERRSGPHLPWWAFGVACYGLGTALESAVTLFGNTAALNKAWYVAGALFGGYPLAQGTVYLLLRRRVAHLLTALTLPALAALSLLVFLSPVDGAQLEAHRPSGAILGWRWLRLCTPFVNLYAVVFLIGGAMLSAVRFAGEPGAAQRDRALGNFAIAFGATLPGIGGTLAKGGMVEALYVGELIGLVFIWLGFRLATRTELAAVRDLEVPI